MKKLSLYVFLVLMFLSASSYSDDIRGIKIEGISIGDSLLDFFSEQEIKKGERKDYYIDDKFTAVDFFDVSFFEIYEGTQIHYKTKDKKYSIFSVDFINIYEDNINECYKKKNELVKELSIKYKSVKKIKAKEKHEADTSGESLVTSVYFVFKSGDFVTVECLDWSERMKYPDQIRVSINLNELNVWLIDPNTYKKK